MLPNKKRNAINNLSSLLHPNGHARSRLISTKWISNSNEFQIITLSLKGNFYISILKAFKIEINRSLSLIETYLRYTEQGLEGLKNCTGATLIAARRGFCLFFHTMKHTIYILVYRLYIEYLRNPVWTTAYFAFIRYCVLFLSAA